MMCIIYCLSDPVCDTKFKPFGHIHKKEITEEYSLLENQFERMREGKKFHPKSLSLHNPFLQFSFSFSFPRCFFTLQTKTYEELSSIVINELCSASTVNHFEQREALLMAKIH